MDAELSIPLFFYSKTRSLNENPLNVGKEPKGQVLKALFVI